MEKNITKNQLLYAYSLLKDYIDEYIYVFNLEEDTYTISDKILDTFNFPDSSFSNAAMELLKLIIPDDRATYITALDKLRSGRQKDMSIVCRWIDKRGIPILVSDVARLMPDENGKEVLLMGRISLNSSDQRKDPLTGLFKKDFCRNDYEKERNNHGHVSGFILKIDIDNLSDINEQMGYETGDAVLRIAADCAKRACPPNMRVYRVDDGFAFLNLVEGTSADAKRVYAVMKRLVAKAEKTTGYNILFTISGGLVAFYRETAPYSDVVQKLNYVMRQTKSNGCNMLTMFSATDYSKHLDRLNLLEHLRISVRNNFEGFELYYQPVVDARPLKGGKEDKTNVSVIGAEALLRWHHPEYNLLGANEIISVLEECGLIIPLGRWILLTAFTQCEIWNQYKPDFRMSVNLSYIQIEKSDLLFDVKMALEKSGVNPKNIILEITESGYIESSEMKKLIDDLSALGVNIDIDDFGTGYSNMRYLQTIHANTLKLDYSIIHKAVSEESNDMVIVQYITRMAHELGMSVCMEGIESLEDIQKLTFMKPDKFQGYLFGRPVNAQTFVDDNLSRSISKRGSK
ncbi:MAG: EAL domain-containing protein [Treponema sp.]|nr:EAL domain-containing protein [Treponema sp.]